VTFKACNWPVAGIEPTWPSVRCLTH